MDVDLDDEVEQDGGDSLATAAPADVLLLFIQNFRKIKSPITAIFLTCTYWITALIRITGISRGRRPILGSLGARIQLHGGFYPSSSRNRLLPSVARKFSPEFPGK